jgi:hypothetical protein
MDDYTTSASTKCPSSAAVRLSLKRKQEHSPKWNEIRASVSSSPWVSTHTFTFPNNPSTMFLHATTTLSRFLDHSTTNKNRVIHDPVIRRYSLLQPSPALDADPPRARLHQSRDLPSFTNREMPVISGGSPEDLLIALVRLFNRRTVSSVR